MSDTSWRVHSSSVIHPSVREIVLSHPSLLRGKTRIHFDAKGCYLSASCGTYVRFSSMKEMRSVRKAIYKYRGRARRVFEESVAKDKHLVFVYGTLKRNNWNNAHYLSTSNFLGTSYTRDKFTLYSSGIPFVHSSPPTCRIKGEVYEVTNATLVRLDSLEGHPHSYERRLTTVRVGPLWKMAWLYFNEHGGGLKLTTGEWNSFQKSLT